MIATKALRTIGALTLGSVLVGVALARSASSQGGRPSGGAATGHVDRLQRVAVIGASLAAGFGSRHSMADALEASIVSPHGRVVDLGETLFFTSPLILGGRAVESALDMEPTLVVAIDFLFWFGYGSIDRGGGAIELESERLELLEKGLEFLEEFECPLILGDFPDMSAAVGKMLSKGQMPAKTTLPLLSRRVREWASKRPNTLVIPLADIVRALGAEDEVVIGRHTFPAGSHLLQLDQLHPTTEGLAAVAQLVCDRLVFLELAREEDFDFEFRAVFDRLRGR